MTLAGTRLFAVTLPLGLMASRLTHSCAYPCLRLCFILAPRCGLGQPGAAVPTQMSEVEGSVLPTLACSSNRACSSSLHDSGHELQQRRCGRAALLAPRSGAHKRWPSGLCRRAESPTHFSANAALKRRSSTVYSAQWLKPAALARLLLQGLKPCSTQRRCETLIHFL